ncbi:hypothetical protein GP924_20430 [Enterobacteriaceae bacterium 8376wB9]|nr:hypothetical protein [Enterobacteriaceae bacterium 8376wB9]
MAGRPSQTILINPVPVKTGVPSVSGRPAAVPQTPVHTGTVVKPVTRPVIMTTPAVPRGTLSDFIYWRLNAAGTGVEPVYVMLSDPRKNAGKVTGKGHGNGERWLHGAGKGTGVPIPSHIADKLRGREFVSFDAFRRAIWTEVGKDSSLIKQFKGNNQENLKTGYSPFTPKSERIGGRTRYELHHVKPISEGGAVYDIDGIRVTTPKRHIKLHKKGK